MALTKECTARRAPGRPRWDAHRRSAWHVGTPLLALGFLSVLGTGRACLAQTPSSPPAPSPIVRPLSVRPHEAATGTRTPQAGLFLLDSVPDRRSFPAGSSTPPDYSVYVPQPCVGTQRCPLLVVLYQGGDWQPIADTNKVIILYLPNTIGNAVPTDTISGIIDAALRQVLRKYAIDPDKIAIAGTCGSGGQAFFWGRSNFNVFNRVVVVSPAEAFTVTTAPQNALAQTYIISGLVEESYYLQNSLRFSRALRHDRLRVKDVLALRAHGDRWEDYKFVGRWLHDSWASPDRAVDVPRFATDSLPVLTTDAVDRLTAYWSRFMAEPDSIQHTARVARLRELVVPVGDGQRTALMSDLPALARAYPSVAADLKAAGLTAQQAEAYRVALISARATKQGGELAGPVPAASALGKNIAFLDAHPDKIAALDTVHMWTTP